MMLTDLFTQNYNTIIVLITTAVLGLSAGLVGCFLVLRKDVLVSDAISHATLPGVAIGFLIAYALGYNDGRYLPLLLICSAFTAALGTQSVRYITNHTRLSADTAIASVTSFFYAFGLMLFGVIQNLSGGNRAGLNSFLLGQVSGLTQSDLIMLALIALIVTLLITIFFKNLRLLCFDKTYAGMLGMNIKSTERLLLALIILVVCAGLKTVGLILIIALLITPPITARLWTNRSGIMALLSAVFGAFSCMIGVYLSSSIADLPTGATIVLCATALFTLSLIITKTKAYING